MICKASTISSRNCFDCRPLCKRKQGVEKLYTELKTAGIDVLFHDGNERPGVMFADLELIGIPHRIVVSERGIDAGTLEYKARTAENVEALPLAEVVGILRAKIAGAN